MSFIAELRQRKVFRVGAAYLVVAWVAIQAASIALPAFDAPAWILRVLILLIALGLPATLLLIWALERTPDGVRMAPGPAGNKRMLAMSAGLAALALAWYFLGQPALRKLQPAVAERSIAVLPFANMSGDPANEYFSDGLAETTLDMLAQLKDLKVISRTSSFAFKGKAADAREIGQALDAAHLLEGSVQQAGDILRITAQLIRTSDGSHLWSQRYDRKREDVFKIQDEIASEVVKALQLALPAAEQQHLLRKRTDNVAAYDEYLKGLALLPRRKVPDLRRALAHFEQAIELDPGYARAHAMAASVYHLLDNYASTTDEERRRQARHVERALSLEPELGEAHIANAALLLAADDIAGADQAFRRGIALAPGFASGHQWYGEFLLFTVGKRAPGLAQYARAVALDPLSPVIRTGYASALAANGRLDEASQQLDVVLARHPDHANAYASRARIHAARGDLVGALREYATMIRSDPDAIVRADERCWLLVNAGAQDAATRCIAELARRAPGRQARRLQAGLAAATGDWATALASTVPDMPHNDWDHAYLLIGNNRMQDALAVLQQLEPGLAASPPHIVSEYPTDFPWIGAALLGNGREADGRALLEHGLARFADRPHVGVSFQRGWSDAYAHALLGRPQQACEALREAITAGSMLALHELDHHPILAEVRTQPCYAQALAPARARMAAQVAAAREAGLL